MLPAKCCFIWPNGYKGEDFLDIDQPETRIAWMTAMFVNRSAQNEQS
jgi:hypothetical protein